MIVLKILEYIAVFYILSAMFSYIALRTIVFFEGKNHYNGLFDDNIYGKEFWEIFLIWFPLINTIFAIGILVLVPLSALWHNIKVKVSFFLLFRKLSPQTRKKIKDSLREFK